MRERCDRANGGRRLDDRLQARVPSTQPNVLVQPRRGTPRGWGRGADQR